MKYLYFYFIQAIIIVGMMGVAIILPSRGYSQCCNYQNSGQNLDTLPTFGVSLGDVDGDGDADAFTVNAYANLNVFTNNGLGQYTLTQTIIPASGEQDNFGVYLVDVDGDNDLDAIVIPFYNSASLKIYKNNGAGNFALFQTVSSNLGCHYAGIGDIDGDGDLDVMLAGWMSSTTKVFKNNGQGTFTFFSTLDLVNFGGINDIALGDFDGDGDKDAAVVSSSQGGRILTNNGTGIFTDSGVTLGNTSDNYYTVVAGDMDKDSDVDLVFGGMYAPLTVLKNNGTGVFSVAATYVSTNYDKHMKLVDYNYDGNPDVFVSTYGSRGLEVWKNTGEGNLSLCFENNQPMPETYSHGFDVGLINNDAYYDVFMGEFGGDGDKVFFGAPSFYIQAVNATICQGEVYTFPDSTTSSVSTVHAVIMMAANGCDSTIVTTLTMIPVDTLVYTNQNILTAHLPNAQYQWLDCNNGYAIIPGQTSQSYPVTSSGAYAVVVTQNGCSDTSSCHSMVITQMDEYPDRQPRFFPNPVASTLNIESDRDYGQVTLMIFDMYGKLCREITTGLSGIVRLDLAFLSPGVYTITIRTKEDLLSHYKLVKE